MKKLQERYRYPVILLRQLVKTDFKLRYQGSVLGYLWSLLRPLALFTVLYIVFVKFIKLGEGIPYYASYLLLGIVLWNFFVEMTSTSVASIVERGDILRKINFPKYIIVVAGSVSVLINLGFNLLVVAFFMFLQGVPVSLGILLAPLLFIELFIFSLGMSFLLSSLYVRYHDIKYIWEVLLQAGFYATPILYPLTVIIDINVLAAKIIMLNPLAQIIQDARYLVITKETDTIGTLFNLNIAYLIPISIVVLMFTGSALYFRSRSKSFAEEL